MVSAQDHHEGTEVDDLATRYGAPAPWRRRLLAAAVAAVVVSFGAWLTWATIYHAEPEVTSTLVTFDIAGEYAVDAVVDVEVQPGTTGGRCLLRALAEDHSVVGEVSFSVEPGQRRYAEVVRTERRANALTSLGCTADGQPQPR